jgi:hypothetical protein
MKIKTGQIKKIFLPLLLFISLCFNILYFLNIIDIRINLVPSKAQELQNKTLKRFIDSPILPETIRINDSVEEIKPKIEPGDTMKIHRIY